MSNIRRNDIVKVIAGNYKGKTGKVLSVAGDKAVVDGINICKKSVKKQSPDQPGFRDIFSPIHISNLALVVEQDGKVIDVKIKKRFVNGSKELYYDLNGSDVVYRVISKKS